MNTESNRWQIKNNVILKSISKLFKERDRTYGKVDNPKFHVLNIKLEIFKSIFIKGQKHEMKFRKF